MNVPVVGPPGGGVHVPPVAGLPPKEANKLKDGSILHFDTVALVPAFALGTTLTLIVAVALGQGN